MRVTTHGAYLVQITRWPVLFPINIYFVREQDSLTLIDTGMAWRAKEILAIARAHQRPITRIVLTHSDSDHIGGLDELRELLPDAEVLMTGLCASVISGEVTIDSQGNQHPAANPRPLVLTEPTGYLKPGDMVGSLQVHAAPGHKPDQIALLDTRDNTLICGDAFQTRGGLAVAGVIRWTFPFPGLATVDKVTGLQTARSLRQLEPSRLAPGHGSVLEEPLEAIDRAISEAAGKIEQGASHAV